MANRSKCTPKKRRLILEAIASGASLTSAAARAGVSRRVVYDWKADNPEFAAELEDAYQVGTDRLADHAMKRALLPDHDALLIFMLKQRDPKRFNQKMVEVVVAGDLNRPIGVEHTESAQPRVQLVILPDNRRGALTEAEIIARRAAIDDDSKIIDLPLPSAAAD